MTRVRNFANVLAVFILFVQLTCEGSSIFGKGKYFGRGLKTKTRLHIPRRSGILETVQAIPPTSVTPSDQVSRENASRDNATFNAPKTDNETLDTANPSVAFSTNFSSVVHDNQAMANNTPDAANVTNLQHNTPDAVNVTNSQQNLQTFSLDQPNSFTPPTSIPAIDTMANPTPTPMGSIDSEMSEIEKPPTIQPMMPDELSSEEKIPDIERIPDEGRIPLGFEEEEPWERSRSEGKHVHSVARNGRGAKISGKNTSLIKSREKMSAYAKRRENVAMRKRKNYGKFNAKEKNLGEQQNGGDKVKRTSFHFKLKSRHSGRPHGVKRDKFARPGKKVFIPPPSPIGPIDLKPFQREKDVGDIKEHTLDFETFKPHEAIDKHLLTVKTAPDIEPISKHFLKHQPSPIPSISPIPPIKNHLH